MDVYERKLMRENETQKKILERQREEINFLKSEIDSLEIDNERKEEIIQSIESFRKEMKQCLEDINKQRNEYEELINEMRQMRDIMDDAMFNKRWKLIRFLIR